MDDQDFLTAKREWSGEKRNELTAEMTRLAHGIAMTGIRRINNDQVIQLACLGTPARIRYLRALVIEAQKILDRIVDEL